MILREPEKRVSNPVRFRHRNPKIQSSWLKNRVLNPLTPGVFRSMRKTIGWTDARLRKRDRGNNRVNEDFQGINGMWEEG
jgi:hypothetical protein